jgi:hypothetical protein
VGILPDHDDDDDDDDYGVFGEVRIGRGNLCIQRKLFQNHFAHDNPA